MRKEHGTREPANLVLGGLQVATGAPSDVAIASAHFSTFDAAIDTTYFGSSSVWHLDTSQGVATVFRYLGAPHNICVTMHSNLSIVIRFNLGTIQCVHEGLISALHRSSVCMTYIRQRDVLNKEGITANLLTSRSSPCSVDIWDKVLYRSHTLSLGNHTSNGSRCWPNGNEKY